MSYSIFARAATKPELKESLAAKMADVVLMQSPHAADQQQALDAANAFIDILKVEPKENQEYIVNMNGSLSWTDATDAVGSVHGANVSISTYITEKAAASV